MPSVNAGARLDRLPISRFHRRVFALVGIGMFLDGFDIYLASAVLGATLQSGFGTMAQSALFVSSTFAGMMLGSVVAGFVGDRYGRCFTYAVFSVLLFPLGMVFCCLECCIFFSGVLYFMFGSSDIQEHCAQVQRHAGLQG